MKYIVGIYSVFHWIPPVAFHYPEIKATEVNVLRLKTPASVAFVFQDIYNETGRIQRNTL